LTQKPFFFLAVPATFPFNSSTKEVTMVDTSVTFRGYTGATLRAAWDKVKSADWRDPVCALVPADILDVVCAAIEFFTATKPAVFVVDFDCKEFVVVAAGYRNGPAGDH
jgi:hypothetical protein